MVIAASGCLWAAEPTPLPQPDLVFYGAVARAPGNEAVTPTTVNWSLSGNSESIAARDTTIVTVGSEVFYLTRIPFEVRNIVGGPTFPATPATLELTPTDTTYTRGAVVELGSVSRPAVLPAGKETFVYGAARLGLVERLDLTIGETYDEWSQRVFGGAVDGGADADADGRTNREEFLQGTDPRSGSSFSILRGFSPASGGGFKIRWDSVPARSYTVEWSATLDGDWQAVGPPWPGTGGPLEYTHPTGGAKRLYFRIMVTGPDP